MNYPIASIAVLLVSTVLVMPMIPSYALTDCTFTVVGTTMTLDNNCTTDETILIPDGFTLDGAGNTITAVDPVSGHFLGAVVKNDGVTANVNNLIVTTSGLANVCDGAGPPDNRLRGILFDGAGGNIIGNTVMNINQGASGCQEGNAIEVRNAPFDGTHPNTLSVLIRNNVVTDYQKTGILANGDVSVVIRNNEVGSSATQANLAANSVQLGFGANGIVKNNNISGNQWCGASEFVATAVLIFDADGSDISQNNIGGNSDIGIYGFGDELRINNNRVFDDASIADCNQFGYDIGIGDYGDDNSITNNKVRGFDMPYDPDTLEDNNKVIPSN